MVVIEVVPDEPAVVETARELIVQLAAAMPDDASKEALQTGLTKQLERPPMDAIRLILQDETVSLEDVQRALFAPTTQDMERFYVQLLLGPPVGAPDSHPARKAQVPFLSMLYLAHVKKWDLARAFVIAGGLLQLVPTLTDANLYIRGQAVDTFMALTDEAVFDWHKAPQNEHDRAAFHSFFVLKDSAFLPALVSNLEDPEKSFPGGAFYCLQLLAFYLSWVRLWYCEDRVLRVSRRVLSCLQRVAAEEQYSKEVRDFAQTVHDDFARAGAVEDQDAKLQIPAMAAETPTDEAHTDAKEQAGKAAEEAAAPGSVPRSPADIGGPKPTPSTSAPAARQKPKEAEQKERELAEAKAVLEKQKQEVEEAKAQLEKQKKEADDAKARLEKQKQEVEDDKAKVELAKKQKEKEEEEEKKKKKEKEEEEKKKKRDQQQGADAVANAAAEKEMGNAAFKRQGYAMAIKHYGAALASTPKDHAILGNRGFAYLKLGLEKELAADMDAAYDAFRHCAEDCTAAVALNPQFVKGFFRKAQALQHMGDTRAALVAAEAAQKLGRNKDIDALVLSLRSQQAAEEMARLQAQHAGVQSHHAGGGGGDDEEETRYGVGTGASSDNYAGTDIGTLANLLSNAPPPPPSAQRARQQQQQQQQQEEQKRKAHTRDAAGEVPMVAPIRNAAPVSATARAGQAHTAKTDPILRMFQEPSAKHTASSSSSSPAGKKEEAKPKKPLIQVLSSEDFE